MGRLWHYLGVAGEKQQNLGILAAAALVAFLLGRESVDGSSTPVQPQQFYGNTPASAFDEPSETAVPFANPISDSPTYFRNCSHARAEGAAPVRVGDPGYAPHLDRDGDGVGCE